MLIATAGHIDHGKTALVRALTGVETDRLPEEKARGISIDLGFAYWRPEPGLTIGFIDVPGHERFVRNMLAGVTGVDFTMLVVAADDGVMPQTIEHLEILDLLGIAHGVAVITKIDRASPARIAEVRGELTALLAGTTLAGIPVVEACALDGRGVPALAQLLRNAATSAPTADGRFRLAIDRVFSVTGAGTVVTGTIIDGEVRTGDRLTIAPQRLETRVRGLQSAGVAVDVAHAGERCAVNIAGIEVAQVHRGDWLCAAGAGKPTQRIEAEVRVLASAAKSLKHDAHVHLHLGAADLPARVLIREKREIAPGEEGLVQFVLVEPTACCAGDRVIVRNASGDRTIGGGTVIDPFAAASRRKDPNRASVSAAFALGNAKATLRGLLAIDGYDVGLQHFADCFNLSAETARALCVEAGAVVLRGSRLIAVPGERVAAVRRQVIELLTALHRDQPDLGGLSAKELSSKAKVALSAESLTLLLKEMLAAREIEVSGSLFKLPGHTAAFSAAERAMWQQVVPWLEERGVHHFTLAELVTELGASEAAVKAMLFRRLHNGDVWAITDKRYMLADHVAMLAATGDALAARTPDGFTPAAFRDASGLGRTFVIQLLEFFDRIGISVRRGDRRLMRDDYAATVGQAEPLAPSR